LIWHRRIQVVLRFQGGLVQSQDDSPNRSDDQAASGPFDAVLRGSLINYEQARAWRGTWADSVPSIDASEISLAGSPRYRIPVIQDGLYRLTCADLHAAGMPIGLGGVDPRTFRLSSQGQAVAIFVQGEADGRCDPGDALTFYGQKFYGDRLAVASQRNLHWLIFPQQKTDGSFIPWQPQFNAVMAEKYTDENVYWLEVGGTPGPRMAEVDGNPSGSPAATPSSYPAMKHAERSLRWWTWHFQGEDTWFWERMQGAGIWTYTTTPNSLVTDPSRPLLTARLGQFL
jgi:hypothetical protein